VLSAPIFIQLQLFTVFQFKGRFCPKHISRVWPEFFAGTALESIQVLLLPAHSLVYKGWIINADHPVSAELGAGAVPVKLGIRRERMPLLIKARGYHAMQMDRLV